jgi:tripartite-type tricarboxylate transporter receptor subunit TctC
MIGTLRSVLIGLLPASITLFSDGAFAGAKFRIRISAAAIALPSLRRATMFAGSMALALSAATGSAAADYPDRPIKLIVPYLAGGSSDIVGRLVAEFLQKEIGQAVYVENIGGAGGATGARRAAASDPDGYTLFVGANSEMLIHKLLEPSLAYDAVRDFKPIALIGTGAIVLVGKSSLEANTHQETIALARSKPGALAYGTSGQGTIQHLIGEMFKARLDMNIIHVPYRGAGPLMNDLVGGHVHLGVATLASALPLIADGRIKPLAVSSAVRSEFAPQIPTLSEITELKGFNLETWYGVFAPAKLPASIAAKLEQKLLAALDSSELKSKLAAQAISIKKMPAKELHDFVVNETERYRSFISEAKIAIK